MSLEVLELAPPAKSPRSMRATRRPRIAASRAIPAPTIPPPITRRPKDWDRNRASSSLRLMLSHSLTCSLTRPYAGNGVPPPLIEPIALGCGHARAKDALGTFEGRRQARQQRRALGRRR